MKIGIVGAGEDKFTALGRKRAIEIIEKLTVAGAEFVSGHSPLGGADIWAEEVALKNGLKMIVCAPEVQSWEDGKNGEKGYKTRNQDIARQSDEMHVIVAAGYPKGYRGRRFRLCYHCGETNHVKSGGCVTGKYFEGFHPGKKAIRHIVENE